MKQVKSYSVEDLLYLMQRLREEDGCPWDKKQTFDSIVPHTIEEVYEVADAIHKKDMSHMKEELGDLLFQVVFYAQMAQEQGAFDFHSIIDQIVRKLLRRHPHVFPDGTLHSRREGEEPDEAEIKQNWERIKAEERAEKAQDSGHKPEEAHLDAVLNALPALVVAEKLQKRAAQVGFDWPDLDPVFDKIEEEIEELKEVSLGEWNQEEIIHELGDILFCCVNLARHVNVSPEVALRKANGRFRQRFGYIESSLKRNGRELNSASLEEMEALWQEAKKV